MIIKGDTVDIPGYEAKMIWKCYKEGLGAIERANEVARQSKLAMQYNEIKWNLVEDLLDMKRNEHGALIPK